MDKWISEKKVKELFKIDADTLLELEKTGKVHTIILMGNKKLYLLSNLENIPRTPAKNLISKIFSWFGKRS